LENILKYEQYFKECSEQKKEVKVHSEQLKDGVRTMPVYIKDQELRNFIIDFYDSEVLNSNYKSHLKNKEIIVHEIQDFSIYSKEDLLAILTFIVRQDRFSEGYLIKKAYDGSIYQIIKYLKKASIEV
jgi:hypothetical protein